MSSHGKCGGHGGQQAEGVREHESSEFKRNLNGGPQADEVRIQVSINDERLMINDCLHTENAEDTEVRTRTLWENVNHRKLNGF